MNYHEIERELGNTLDALRNLRKVVDEAHQRQKQLHSLLARIYRANYVPTADETFPNQEEIEKALGIGKEPK